MAKKRKTSRRSYARVAPRKRRAARRIASTRPNKRRRVGATSMLKPRKTSIIDAVTAGALSGFGQFAAFKGVDLVRTKMPEVGDALGPTGTPLAIAAVAVLGRNFIPRDLASGVAGAGMMLGVLSMMGPATETVGGRRRLSQAEVDAIERAARTDGLTAETLTGSPIKAARRSAV